MKNVKKLQKVIIQEEVEITEVNKKGDKMKKAIIKLECFCIRMKEHLSDIIMNTSNQIRKKQSSTYEEMEADKHDEPSEDEVLDSDEEERFFNPKKVPLGWDGKPIPYWLFKLHGLSIKYKCEICGDFTYWGRRAYEKHF